MMQTAMMPFPAYSFTCPLFLDVSPPSHATSPSATPSPPASSAYGSAAANSSASPYGDMSASSGQQQTAYSTGHSVGHSSFYAAAATLGLKPGHEPGVFGPHAAGKPTFINSGVNNPRKSVGSSFTIKAILGLSESDHSDHHHHLHHAAGHLRSAKDFAKRHDRLLNSFSSAALPVLQDSGLPTTAIPTRTPISPDSTAKEVTKYSKTSSKSHCSGDSLTSRDSGAGRLGSGQSHHHHSHTGSGNAKAKRVRTIFTPEQLERLESEFERQQYMVGPERLYLASALNLTEAQVKVWFQNRRIKWRKQHMALQRARLAKLRQEDADSEMIDMCASQSRDEEHEELLEDDL